MKFIVENVDTDGVTLRAPPGNYRNRFQFDSPTPPALGSNVFGTIHAVARKMEAVSQGGNYVEPLFGRPRRMQGLVLAQRDEHNELVVRVGYDVTVRLPPGQKASDFAVGSRVGWDNAAAPRFVWDGPSDPSAASGCQPAGDSASPLAQAVNHPGTRTADH